MINQTDACLLSSVCAVRKSKWEMGKTTTRPKQSFLHAPTRVGPLYALWAAEYKCGFESTQVFGVQSGTILEIPARHVLKN
jgi:hypothetical protein